MVQGMWELLSNPFYWGVVIAGGGILFMAYRYDKLNEKYQELKKQNEGKINDRR